jgi:PTS system nitrogen regulatory IIA component
MINADAVHCDLKAGSKKQALQKIANSLASVTGSDERVIFEKLHEREKLGTTGMGDGTAIPHAKLNHLDRVYTLFARTEQPLDFEAVDDRPVDLIFALLAPQNAGADHLKALARVSRALRDDKFCNKVRGAKNDDAIASLLLNYDVDEAA